MLIWQQRFCGGLQQPKGIWLIFVIYPRKDRFGIPDHRRGSSHAEESGDIISKALWYTLPMEFPAYGRGLLEEAEKHLLKGIEFCERLNEKGWNAMRTFYLGRDLF